MLELFNRLFKLLVVQVMSAVQLIYVSFFVTPQKFSRGIVTSIQEPGSLKGFKGV